MKTKKNVIIPKKKKNMKNKGCTVIALSNFKGGTGKTTTSVNLAHGLADRGYKVLVFDLDPQANLTDLMGLYGVISEEHCISNVLRGKTELVVNHVKENLFVVGADSESMIGIDFELQSSLRGGDTKLREIIEPVKAEYDFIILDLAPALNILTVNAYVASDRIMVPIVSDYLSSTGFYKLEERLKKDLNMQITDVLITKHESNTSLAREVVEDFNNNRPELFCQTIIPKNVAISEQGISKLSIFDYAPESTGAHAYMAFVEEFLHRLS